MNHMTYSKLKKSVGSCIFIMLFLLHGAIPASGDIFSTYGFGIKGMSMGGAVCATIDDGSSVYYNPAGLGKVDGSEFGFSFLYTMPNMALSHSPSNAPDNDDLGFTAYLIDMSFDLNTIINTKRNLSFGMGLASLGDGTMIVMEDLPAESYQYVQFGSTLQRVTMYMGLGIEAVQDLLWLGVGAHISFSGDAEGYLSLDIDENVDVLNPGEDYAMSMVMGPATQLTIGIMLKPIENLNFGLSYRGSTAIDLTPFVMDMKMNIGAIQLETIRMIMGIFASYSPASYQAGISYSLGNLTAEVDVTMDLWSEFTRGAIRELTHDNANIPNAEFEDVWSYRLGLEYRYQSYDFWAGYQYAPTPVPQQYGESNYLDSDRHIVSIGAGKGLGNLFGILKYPLWAGLSLQEQVLVERTFYKSASSDYSLSGNVFSAMFSVKLQM